MYFRTPGLASKGTRDTEQWQWTEYFSMESQSDITDHDAYVYQSGTAMSPDVQARFILDDNEMAHTLPWEIQRPADSKSPIDINGYDALLQLFIKDNKACARLYIKKTFTNWMDEFQSSWVGFYSDGNTGTSKYVRWQWAINFKIGHSDISDYDMYVYRTDMAMSPGVDARFILWGRHGEKARTSSWGIQNPAKEKVEIKGHDVSLQIYTEEGYACTRLYIKKSFTDWVDTFDYSWVGFYSDEHQGTSECYDWQWVTGLSKETQSDIWDYDTYLYRSDMAMSPGVQARFMLLNSGVEKARTLPWEIQRLANSKYPVDIKGRDARLQLYVKNGKACARLYIRKTFTNWENQFYNSWVGLYSDENTF